MLTSLGTPGTLPSGYAFQQLCALCVEHHVDVWHMNNITRELTEYKPFGVVISKSRQRECMEFLKQYAEQLQPCIVHLLPDASSKSRRWIMQHLIIRLNDLVRLLQGKMSAEYLQQYNYNPRPVLRRDLQLDSD